MSKPAPYSAKVAIPLPPEDVVREAMGGTYKPDVLNLTKMLAGTGDCFPAVVALVKALFQADDIQRGNVWSPGPLLHRETYGRPGQLYPGARNDRFLSGDIVESPSSDDYDVDVLAAGQTAVDGLWRVSQGWS